MPKGVIEEINNGNRCPYCGHLTVFCVANDFFKTDRQIKGFVKYCKKCDAYAYDANKEPHRRIANKGLRDKQNVCEQYYKCLVRKKILKNANLDIHAARYKLNAWVSKLIHVSPANAYPRNFDEDQCNAFLSAVKELVTTTELVSLDESNFKVN